MTSPVSGPPVASSSLLPSASIQPNFVSLLTLVVSAPDSKRVQVFIAPSVKLPLLMTLLDLPPFPKPIDMSNTSVISVAVFSSSSSMPLASSVGSLHPLTKQKVKSGPSSNGGRKRIPPSLKDVDLFCPSNETSLGFPQVRHRSQITRQAKR